MIAILEAHRAGLYRRSQWLPNIIAGVIVGVVALPLAMAFAIASGVKPEQGLYTAIIAGLIVALFGGSRVQIAGPTGAFIVILVGIGADHGLAGLQVATLMAGVILILMGVFRLGAIIRFIPAPVIAGFTAGIGIIIWFGQWDAFFGLPKPEGEHFHQKFINVIRDLPNLNWPTTLLGLTGLAVLIGYPKIPRLNRIPAPLIAMLAVTIIQRIFQFDGVATIGTAFGGIPSSLPSYTAPDISFNTIIELLGPAFTIALLCAIESLLSAMVADGMANTRHDSNQELIGQGLANMATSLFGGIAATGAIARTATNIRNGGSNPIAGIVHCITLVAIILVFAEQSASIPLTALAAILFVVAWNMSDVRHVVRMARTAPMADVVTLLATLLLTVFTDLVVAVNVGVILATLHFLRRMSTSVEVLPVSDAEINRELATPDETLPPNWLVFSIEGPYFFAAVSSFERALQATHADPEVLIIRLGRVPFMDITGLQGLEEVIGELQARGVDVRLCEANLRVKTKLIRAKIIPLAGAPIYFETFREALTCPVRVA
jgi:SulP family sulfate permease